MALMIQYCSIKILNKYIENIQITSIYPDQYI